MFRRSVLAASALAVVLVISQSTVAEAQGGGLSITAASPRIVAGSQSITVTGTGFASSIAANAVTINGRTAAVTAATPESLTISLPSGATSGALRVAVDGQSAEAPDDVFVPPSPYTPADVAYASRVASEQLTVPVSMSGKVGLATFAGVAGDRLSFRLTNGTFGTSSSSAKITIYRPDGSALVAGTSFGNSGAFLDTRALPATGTYTALVDPSGTATGQVNLSVIRVPDDAVVSAPIPTSAVEVGTSTPGQNATVLIPATAGQRFSISLDGSTFGTSNGLNVSVTRPDGTVVVPSRSVSSSSNYIDTITAVDDGVFQLNADPLGPATGKVSVTVRDVPSDPIAFVTTEGLPVTVATATPGQNAYVSFDGEAGQRVSLYLRSSTFGSSTSSVTLSVTSPTGSSLVAPRGFGSSGTFVEPVTLPATGTYRALIDPQGPAIGQVVASVHSVADTTSGAIDLTGNPVEVKIDAPGENATRTLQAAPGGRASLEFSASTFAGTNLRVSVSGPDGTSVVSSRSVSIGSTLFVEPFGFTQTGTYTVTFDPVGASTGKVAIRAFEVPGDTEVAVSPSPDADPQTLTTTAPGQNGTWTFDAAPGQRVSLKLAGSTYGASTGSASVSFVRADNTSWLSGRGLGSSEVFIDTTTLNTEGNHKVRLDPSASLIGSARLTVFEVPPDPTTDLTVGSGATSLSNTTPGQDMRATVPATAGQKVTLDLGAPAFTPSSTITASVLGPAGETVVTPRSVGSTGSLLDLTAQTSGTFQLILNPSGQGVGSLPVRVVDSADGSYTLSLDGQPTTVTTSTSGQNAVASIDGTAGTRVSLALVDSTYGSSTSSATVAVTGPNGASIVSARGFGANGVFIDPVVLPVSGTYRVIIDPQGATTGQVTVRAWSVPTDVSSTATTDGLPATASTTTPGQNAVLTFDATAGQRFSVQVADGTFGASTSAARVSLIRPDGSVVGSALGFGNAGAFLDAMTASATGMYKILVDPQGGATGQVTVRLWGIPSDLVAPIGTDGAATALALDVPGQNGAFEFYRAAGDRFSIHLLDGTFGQSSARYSVVRPDGVALVTSTAFSNAGIFVDAKQAPVSGMYRVVIDPQSSATGQVHARVWNVPADAVVNGQTDGRPVRAANSTPGQNAFVTVSLRAGQRFSLRLSNGTFASSGNARVGVMRPGGTSLVSATSFGDSGLTIDTLLASGAGTYRVMIDPQAMAVGHVIVQVFDVPPDQQYSIDPGGPFVRAELSTPGQDAYLLATGLSANTGYRLRVDHASATSTVSAKSATGEVVDAGELASAPDDVVTFTTRSAGDYEIRLNPNDLTVGSWRLELYTRVGTPRISGPPTGQWRSTANDTYQFSVDRSGPQSGYSVAHTTTADDDPGPISTQGTSTYSRTGPEGISWLHVRAVMSDGTASRVAHVEMRVDTVPPVADPPRVEVEYEVGYVNAAATWAAEDATSGVDHFEYGVGKLEDGGAQSLTRSTHPAASVSGLADGTYEFLVLAVDAAGNKSTPQSTTFVVNSLPPSMPGVASPTHTDPSSTYTTPAFVGRFTQPVSEENVASWSWSITATPDDDPSTPTRNPVVRTVLQPGTHYLNVRAHGTNGMSSPTAHFEVKTIAGNGGVMPIPGQELWAVEDVAFECGTDATYSIFVTGPVQRSLGDGVTSDSGICTVSWQTAQRDSDGDRVFPTGAYDIVLATSDGNSELARIKGVDLIEPGPLTSLIEHDLQQGLIEPADVSDLLLASLGEDLPARYTGASAPGGQDHGHGAALRLLADNWYAQSEASRQAWAALEEGPSLPSQRARRSSSANCSSAVLPDSFPTGLLGEDACFWVTEHFILGYGNGTMGAVDDDGVPLTILEQAAAFEDAWDLYESKGFDVPAMTPVYYTTNFPPTRSGFTPGKAILINASDGNLDSYLPHHEFFHAVQWQYINVGDFALLGWRGPGTLYWWMEATANWAAFHADSELPTSDRTYGYAGELNKFLDKNDHEFDQPKLTDPLGREYGAFIFFLYLEQYIDPNAVLKVTEQIGDGVKPTEPASAIEDLLADNDVGFGSAMQQFRWSSFVLDRNGDVGFEFDDIAAWRRIMADQDDPSLPGARAPHESHSISTGDGLEGSVTLEATGARFIEVTPADGHAGAIRFLINGGDDIDASATSGRIDSATDGSGIETVTLCDPPEDVDFDDDSDGDITVVTTTECPTAFLQIISTQKTTQSYFKDDSEWEARFLPTAATLSNGVVEMGVTEDATLIAGTSEPVGLRRAGQEDSEVLAHGCRCEGWGVGNYDVSGAVTSNGQSDNITSSGMLLGDDEATVLTQVGPLFDGFLVEHHFVPSSESDLYQVDVTVTNTSGSIRYGLKYRRTFDWDVAPTPFKEFVSLGQFSGRDTGYLTYSSNDGFGSPNPSSLVTSLGSEGFFEKVGPADQGGFVELNVGSLAPFESRTFRLFYGVAQSEDDAVLALARAGAQMYSLGYSSTSSDQASVNTPVAVFGVDGDELPGTVQARGRQARLPGTAESRVSKAPEQRSGR